MIRVGIAGDAKDMMYGVTKVVGEKEGILEDEDFLSQVYERSELRQVEMINWDRIRRN